MALYVTVFDANDADSEAVDPGRSPVAETRLEPNDETIQRFH